MRIYQDEIQSALWSRGSVNLFTCALYHHGTTKTLLICTEYKGKDKFATAAFLNHLYATEIPLDDTAEEVIWSDGPGSEFKNKFMRHLMENLSNKYDKPFVWKFSATSHGKGVVDGVGGKIKSSVRRKVMGKGERIIVQDCESFVETAKTLTTSTKIIHISEATIQKFRETDPFENVVPVNGISKMHVMFVDSNNTFLWQNSEFHKTAEPDIMLNRKVSIEATTISNDCEVSMEPIDFAVDEDIKPMEMVKVEEGMWGIVIYGEEKWLGKVIKKHVIKCVCVV